MINKQKSNLIYQLLFGLVIFLIPTNLFLKFFESTAYINGLQIDYLIPKLYLIDLIILSSFLFWLIENIKNLFKFTNKFKKNLFKFVQNNKLGSFLIISLLLRQINSYNPVASWWYVIKLIEISLFSLLIYHKRRLLSHKWIMISFLPTIIFQSVVALFQFFNQAPILGYLFLGESNLNKQIGLAKQTIGGVEKILPYGTTAHPNILGGFLSLSILIIIGVLLNPKIKKNKYHLQPFIYGPLGLAFITLILTFSWSAWLLLVIGISLILFKLENKKLLISSIILILISPLIIFFANKFTDNPSISRRHYLNQTATSMSSDHLLWGVGLNNFTTQVEKYSPTREVVRFTQPSHNSFLLIFSEIGLIGIGLLFFIVSKSKKILATNLQWGRCLLTFVPILTLDHYVITNLSSLLMIVIFILLTKNSLSRLQK
jgi:O-antigen ligase